MNPSALRASLEEIHRAIAVLFRATDVVEMRIPNAPHEGTVSGYYSDHEALAKHLASRNVNGYPAIYVTMNPVATALLARCANRVKARAKVTTSDKDIVVRIWLLIDCDPVRPAGISSTDAEHAASLERARDIAIVLREELGFPEPILADSGNGAHLLYRVDLPNDDAATKLVERVLKALAARFDDAAVKIDQTVFNAARITKAYGTVVRKGDNLPGYRPHRLSKIITAPANVAVVPRELLEALAASAPPPPPGRSEQRRGGFSVEEWIRHHGLPARESVSHENGRKWVLEECPFDSSHKAPDSAIFERADGSLGFKCFHSSCAQYGWHQLREHIEGLRQQSNPQSGARPASEQRPQAGALLVRCVTDIPARPLSWLWRHRIPRGKITLLVGHPGLGKTVLTTSLAAVVTTGGQWPADGGIAVPGDVVFASGEDDPSDTLRPRLEAAGADLSRVHILEGAIAGFTGEGRRRVRMLNLQQDIEALSQKLAEIGNVAMAVIDPISAFLGDVDSHKNAEVRGVLAPLAELAGERGTAIIGVTHFSKQGAGPEALLRVLGSIAFVAAARAAYLVAADPEDKSRRLFLPIKANLSPDSSSGLAFRVEGATIANGTIETARVAWEPDPVTITADEAIRPQEPPQASVLGQAIEWLQWTLREPTLATEVYARAAKMGISKISIRRAADSLKVRKRKTVPEGRWAWSLPEEQGAQDAQGAQDFQGAQTGDPLSTLGPDTLSTTNNDHLEHLDHLGQSKELNGQNKVLKPIDHLDHLGQPDQARLLPDDGEFAEIEL
jgi:hypothetical protein